MPAAYTVSLDDDTASRLEAAARNAKSSPADLIAACVSQHLDVAIRHLAAIERLEAVDEGLLELAAFIGRATAGGEIDLSKICRCPESK